MADTAEEPSAKNDTLTLEFWDKMWTDGTTGWHEQDGNDMLKRTLPKVLKKQFPDKEPKELKIFVPLCGKAKDMHILHQLGLTVVGVEFAAQPIKEFFEENSIPVDESKDNGPFTKSTDGGLIIGQGDLFSFDGKINTLPYTEFDLIWDRGSFEAMNQGDRGKYAKFMTNLLSYNGAYLLHVYDYNRNEYPGPPLAASKEELEELYGEKLAVEPQDMVDWTADGSPDRELWMSMGLTKMISTLYLMTRVNK